MACLHATCHDALLTFSCLQEGELVCLSVQFWFGFPGMVVRNEGKGGTAFLLGDAEQGAAGAQQRTEGLQAV